MRRYGFVNLSAKDAREIVVAMIGIRKQTINFSKLFELLEEKFGGHCFQSSYWWAGFQCLGAAGT